VFSESSGTYELVDLPEPGPDTYSLGVSGPTLLPRQYIAFYSPSEWETFVYEWARALEGYFQVQIPGGSGDRGLDVVGMLSEQGTDGLWDCFQCKHYNRALKPGDAYPEMYKVICGVVDEVYALPRRYRFLAPHGCGPTLTRLLSSPSKLKEGFLGWMEGSSSPLHHAEEQKKAYLRTKALEIDYSLFKAEDLEDVVSVHRRSPNHVLRFGTQPITRARELAQTPSEVDLAREAVYVKKLVEVYNERHGTAWKTEAEISDVSSREHFKRAREAFFSAEDLRGSARDQVPAAVFSDLQQDIYDGVVDIEQMDHANGMSRLAKVTEKASTVPLDSSPLIRIIRPRDRTGLCHQLANDDRLNWIRAES
jgi:hypothetical protein